MNEFTIKQVKKAVHELDPGTHCGDINMIAITVFMAVTQVDIDEEKVSQFIGYKGLKDKAVRGIFKRMEKYGIIVTLDDGRKGLQVEWFKNEDNIAYALLLDAMVVNGQLTRSYDSVNDTFIYTPTEHLSNTWSGYSGRRSRCRQGHRGRSA